MRLLPRSLRYRVPLVILAVFLAVAAVFMYGLSRIVFNSFVEVERTEIVKDAQRAELALNVTLERLSGGAADWAKWTDAYEYMAGRAPQFARENVDSTTFVNLDSDFIVFYGYDGTIKWQGAATASGEVGPLSPESRRVSRRLHRLRGWGHGQTNALPTGST